MSEIPEPALEKAEALLGWNTEISVLQGRDNVARFIADVSEKAKKIDIYADEDGYDTESNMRSLLFELILPNPEDDLLKEAREIAKVGGYEEDEGVVQIIARGIEHGRQGRK